MMKRISKYSIIIFIFSFLISQDYSLMNISWEPQNPNQGDNITIYMDASNAEYFKYSYQMNIHLSLDGEEYSTFPMVRNWSQGLFVWSYNYIINQDIYFQIDNNIEFNNIDVNIISVLDDDIFKEAKLLLGNQDYQGCIVLLKSIMSDYQEELYAAKAEYMIAEIFLNDFEEYGLAANYYQNIISNYPSDYDETKKSMFTLAYIYANYLDYYSDAILLYEEFKRNYPTDDLITSINYELENLTKIDKEIQSLINSSK